MDEHDLRHAFNRAMAHTPPGMDPDAALTRAQSAYRRRRAAMVGGGAAVAVAVIAAGAIVVAGHRSVGPAAQGPAPALTSTPPSLTTAAPTTAGTKTSWPNGQTDRTATAGVRYEDGAELLDLITAGLPDGLESPDLPWSHADYVGPSRKHQAQYDDTVNGVEVWDYLATTTAGADGRYGKVTVQVFTPGNTRPTEPCALATTTWGVGADCEVHTVDGKQVGVASGFSPNDGHEQAAAYRHPDGTIVTIGQSRAYEGVGKPGLAELPLPLDTLLELVIADRFALD